MLFANVLPVLLVIAGIGVHVWASWIDDQHFHLSPIGHGVVLAMYAWIITLVVASAAFAVTKPHSRWSGASLAVAVIGISLIVVPSMLHLIYSGRRVEQATHGQRIREH